MAPAMVYWCPGCGGLARNDWGRLQCAARQPCGFGALPWWDEVQHVRPISRYKPRPRQSSDATSKVGTYAFIPEWDA